MITETQRAERINYIGSSDSAGILGISRWTTPLQVWGEKTGNIVATDISDRLPVKLGNRLEQTVAELFMEETGLKVRRVNETLYHPKYPFLAANLDRRVVGSDSIVECKVVSAWKAKEFAGQDIPSEYLAQMMHALAVSGHQSAYLAVLIGNQNFIVKKVERDNRIIAEMERKLVHFWETYVVPKVMPMLVSSNDSETLYQLFPMEDASELTLGDDVDALCEARQAMFADLKSLEGQIDKLENEIKIRMQEAAVATTARHKISWKAQSRMNVDVKLLRKDHPDICEKYMNETKTRVLRIRAIKETE